MYGIGGPIGSYIPYVVVPCESNIGDTLTFIITLSLGPITCPLVPWLCCPLDFSDSSISISARVNCTEKGAVYGATIFWTMQIFSIFGLVFAIAGLAKCTAKEVGYPLEESIPIIAAFDLSETLNNMINQPDVIEIPLNPTGVVKTKLYDLLREAYLKDVEKDRLQSESDDKEKVKDLNATLVEDSSAPLNRTRRQARVVDVPIPTLLGHVPGPDDPDTDVCERDEVLLDDGDCYELLEQGSCEDDEFVIMDPNTRKGFCAPRLCPPGRVFLFSDQLCHDPREAGLCPPGRMLFTSSFGTPLCGCPDGTYEEDDDLDDNVCEPILGQIPNCPSGEVFWFTDFRSPPACRPDPCKGLNLKRGPEDLPYVPALVDRKCYKIGSQPSFCKSDQFYSLSLKYLRGVCSTLDEAGYTVLDDGDVSSLTNTFGEFITKDSGSSKPRVTAKPRISSSKPTLLSFKPSRRPPKITPAGTSLLPSPEIGAPVMKMENASVYQNPIIIGQSVVANHHPALNEVDPRQPVLALAPTHMNAFSTPLITVNGSTTMLGFVAGMFPTHHFGKRSTDSDNQGRESTSRHGSVSSEGAARAPRHHRRKRSPLPFASPGNVIEPGLTSCRAGAIRDINAKCRNTVLPSRFPPSRPTRDVSPTKPSPSCPGGGYWGLGRTCSSSSSGVASVINRLGLG
ncbi:uncharacterized protein [Macrobrachium rosenbergii]|uniref:uncharacterized protein isoform X1 n=2 Tax=Macrobrachium rosenbergii TaxID=79674 RepID=UPI0034D4489E